MEISNGRNCNQEMVLSHPSPSFPRNLQQEKKPKYQQNQAPNSCPRCDSTNTKFCYYNNYSLSQPRYFCKACRRYWTKGGILRNVPVGGGCRKNKRSSSSNSSSSSFTTKSLPPRPQESLLMINNIPKPPSQSMATMPNFPLPNDLTLAFDPFLLESPNPNPNPSFLDILRGGGVVEPTGHQSHVRGGFQSLCYGFGGGGNDQRGMLAFHGGSHDSTLIAAAEPVMAVRRDGDDDDVDDDDVGGGNNNAVGLGLEAGRDYWNDNGTVSSSSWHGLVNTSFL